MDSESFYGLLKRVVPELFPKISSLPAGTSERCLDEVEQATGLQLPEELRRFLSRCNGLGEGVWLSDRLCLLSAEQIVDWWRIHVDTLQWVPDDLPEEDGVIVHRDPEIQPLIASRHWLPVAEEVDGNFSVYADFNPTAAGQLGQIILVYPEATEWRLIAPSIGGLWDWFAEDIKRRSKIS